MLSDSFSSGRKLREARQLCITTAVQSVLLFCGLAANPCPAWAWVYPEHRDIALAALRDLDPERRKLLDQIWSEARHGNEARLCDTVAAVAQGEEPKCIDYAAWPAIAGDHSCSSEEMLRTILLSPWILDVADVTARLKHQLAKTRHRNYLVNALRDSDIELQRADPHYATRAESNAAHFLLARAGIGVTPAGYASASFSGGVELNALAVYASFHVDALEKARALAQPTLTAEERRALALAVLADEAFALHFLEDVFAAGHVAGSWGDASLRKGTHDYYNEHGLVVTTWNGEHVVLTGDAWMRTEDATRTARSIRTSLEQVLDAIRGVGTPGSIHVFKPPTPAPSGFNVCRSETVTQHSPHDARALLIEVLKDTPVPMLASGLGAMPRFRTELGPFIGIEAAARAASWYGGFSPEQQSVGGSGTLELGFRAGFGLDGVMNEAGDGLVSLHLGIRRDGSSTNRFGDAPSIPEAGAITAAIPGRLAYVARLRMPFWLLPLDLLVAGPLLLLVSPATLTSMAVTAANGGLIPWQSGIATPVGRFQFVIGREIGVGLYGYWQERDKLVVPSKVNGETEYSLIGLSSIELDCPVLEYRPFRSFSSDQSSSLVLQLFAGVDIPTRVSVEVGRKPALIPVWLVGLRLSFDWRYYL